MARLRFEIKGDPNSVSLETYSQATLQVMGILRELDTAISRRSTGTLNWYISRLHNNGTLLLEVLSKQRQLKRQTAVPADVSAEVAASFITGLDNIEHHGTSPPYLTDSGMRKVKGMVSLIHKNGAKGFVASAPDVKKSVDVSERSSKTIDELLPVKTEAVGSVEGRLEAISIHGSKKFVIYHSVSNKAVNCLFDQQRIMDKVLLTLGGRVVVFGEVFSNAKGEPVRVAVSDFDLIDVAGRLPSVSEIAGSDPNFTGSLSTEEYIRSIRRG
ncbi:MAG: hypothetical protein JNM66_05405 [Bryobacterales bacterium]|nr:hypothetical protein [Bryobacterales bacterium]